MKMNFELRDVITSRLLDLEYKVMEVDSDPWTMDYWKAIDTLSLWCSNQFGNTWHFQWGRDWGIIFHLLVKMMLCCLC